MEPATDSRSGSGLIADTVDGRDWSRLPEDLLISVLGALRILARGVRRVRRLRLPSRRQPPCLLYASDTVTPGATALHCLATGGTLQIPFPRALLARRPQLGSGHGWLVTADEASDLHLLNPVTGAATRSRSRPSRRSTTSRVARTSKGDPAYLIYENQEYYNYLKHRSEIETEPTILEVDQAHNYMYYRVTISASPSAGCALVVLLLHMPYGEISFARVGDERWTWVTPGDGGKGLPWNDGYVDAM